MELYNGRPENTEGRLAKEIRVYDFLDALGIEYERVDHEAAMTIDACEEIDRILEISICKNLFLCNRQETSFYLLMMPGDKKFKTKDLSAQINSARLSFENRNIWNSSWTLRRISERAGADERQRTESAASYRRGYSERALHRLPSLHQYIQPENPDAGYDGKNNSGNEAFAGYGSFINTEAFLKNCIK